LLLYLLAVCSTDRVHGRASHKRLVANTSTSILCLLLHLLLPPPEQLELVPEATFLPLLTISPLLCLLLPL